MTHSEEVSPRKYSSPTEELQHALPEHDGVRVNFQHSQQIVHTQKLHVGPLPSASDLEAYSRIGNNGEVLTLILEMARKNNDTQNKTAHRAQWFSFISDVSRTLTGLAFGLVCLFVAYTLAMHDHPYIASLIATTTILIGLGVLVMRILPTKDGQASPPQGDE